MDLEPAQIALGLVVVEGNREIVQEGERLVSLQQEPCKHVARGRLGQPATLPRSTFLVRRRRIGGQPGLQQRMVAGDEIRAVGRRQADVSQHPCVVGGRLHLAQQRFHVGGPRLMILLLEEGQLAQMMDVAQRMATRPIHAIAAPAVMHAHAAVVR